MKGVVAVHGVRLAGFTVDFKQVFERVLGFNKLMRIPVRMTPKIAPSRSRSESPTKSGGSAVVTGAAQGIGRAIAAALVREGFAVIVADLDLDLARVAAAEIGAVDGFQLDVRDQEAHRNLATRACSVAPLAVWVNNAGVGYDGDLVDLAPDRIRALVDTNVMGVIWGMRAALDVSGFTGDIVNVASLSGHGPVPGLSVYAATKVAVVSLTLSVSGEVPTGVLVHAICPDGVATALVSRMLPNGRANELVASGGTLMTGESVADAVIGLLGSRRVVQTLPMRRGALLRCAALLPRTAQRLEPMLRAQGRKNLRRT